MATTEERRKPRSGARKADAPPADAKQALPPRPQRAEQPAEPLSAPEKKTPAPASMPTPQPQAARHAAPAPEAATTEPLAAPVAEAEAEAKAGVGGSAEAEPAPTPGTLACREILFEAIASFVRANTNIESSVPINCAVDEIGRCARLQDAFPIPLQRMLFTMDAALRWVLLLTVGPARAVDEGDAPCDDAFSPQDALALIPQAYDLGARDALWAHFEEEGSDSEDSEDEGDEDDEDEAVTASQGEVVAVVAGGGGPSGDVPPVDGDTALAGHFEVEDGATFTENLNEAFAY